MTNEEIIERLLRQYWEDECLMAGEHAVKQIAEDAAKETRAPIIPASGGHNVDFSQVLGLLADAAGVISMLISFAALRQSSTQSRSATDQETLKSRLPNEHGLDPKQIEEMYAEIRRIVDYQRNN